MGAGWIRICERAILPWSSAHDLRGFVYRRDGIRDRPRASKATASRHCVESDAPQSRIPHRRHTSTLCRGGCGRRRRCLRTASPGFCSVRAASGCGARWKDLGGDVVLRIARGAQAIGRVGEKHRGRRCSTRRSLAIRETSAKYQSSTRGNAARSIAITRCLQRSERLSMWALTSPTRQCSKQRPPVGMCQRPTGFSM